MSSFLFAKDEKKFKLFCPLGLTRRGYSWYYVYSINEGIEEMPKFEIDQTVVIINPESPHYFCDGNIACVETDHYMVMVRTINGGRLVLFTESELENF